MWLLLFWLLLRFSFVLSYPFFFEFFFDASHECVGDEVFCVELSCCCEHGLCCDFFIVCGRACECDVPCVWVDDDVDDGFCLL